MKNFTLFFLLLSVIVCAQSQPIDNKGNRNQSYPIISATKPEVVQLINQVEQDNLEAYIRYMQQFIRNAEDTAALTVQNWLIDCFESYGYEDITVQKFTFNLVELDAGNVIVVKKGTKFPDEYILISSHYDHPSGPGADDNASGTAGVLECARLLKNYDTKRSIIFAPFNAEELWMVGSMPFAKKCAAENKNIIAVLNMDMIGWFPPDNSKTIMASGYSYISKALFEYYEQTANTYVPEIPTIQFTAGDSYGGDHMPFNIYEYPALYIGDIEYKDLNTCYHESCDTIGPYQVGINCGVNRFDLAQAFVQSVLASAAELANAWLPPQNLSACSGMDKITVSWDGDSESTSYKIFKDNKLLNETTETFYVDYDVETGNKYEYYVVAVNEEQETAPSNKDEVTFVNSLILPYLNDFSANKYGFEQSEWVCRNANGKSALCNTEEVYDFPDNYLSIAELDWFPIPADTENITVRFKWQGYIRGIWNNTYENWYNAGLFFEVTNDRKTWHKLGYLSGNSGGNWKDCEFSLNQFTDSKFFQARFRLESSGSHLYQYQKRVYITDFEIVFETDTANIKEQTPYISSFNFFPNPASDHINIVTDEQNSYHIAIYDMTGRVIFAQDGFIDGVLSVAHLKAGSYFIVASTKQHRVARKLLIK